MNKIHNYFKWYNDNENEVLIFYFTVFALARVACTESMLCEEGRTGRVAPFLAAETGQCPCFTKYSFRNLLCCLIMASIVVSGLESVSSTPQSLVSETHGELCRLPGDVRISSKCASTVRWSSESFSSLSSCSWMLFNPLNPNVWLMSGPFGAWLGSFSYRSSSAFWKMSEPSGIERFSPSGKWVGVAGSENRRCCRGTGFRFMIKTDYHT